MHDLPTGPSLLALARAVLLEELVPLLPPERRYDALLVGNCLAIAEREASAGGDAAAEGADRLAALYARKAMPADRAADHDTEAQRPAAIDGTAKLWRIFADDLRVGAFENSERDDRLARAILWRLTIGKLRLANPKFLSVNGVVGRGGGGD